MFVRAGFSLPQFFFPDIIGKRIGFKPSEETSKYSRKIRLSLLCTKQEGRGQRTLCR